MTLPSWRGVAWALATLTMACGADGASTFSDTSGAPTPGGAAGSGGSTSGASGGSAGGATTPLPPEREIESEYQAPVASSRYVWVANPKSGRVAFVDAATSEVSLVEAGNAPTYVASIPGAGDAAIVLNVLSKDATIMRVGAGGAITARKVPLPSGGNNWTVSPSGKFAIAWTDAKLVKSADALDGYQDVAVVDLTSGAEKSVTLAVGYRPQRISFEAGEKRAFVVSQDGVTIVDLAGDAFVSANVRLTDPGKSLDSDDVVILPDGLRAVVRRPAEKGIGVVDLATGERKTVPLPSVPTDLDLASDGHTVFAVLRETGDVAAFPVPEALDDPKLVTTAKVAAMGQIIGSAVLAKTGARAFVFTSAVPEERLSVVSTADLAQPPLQILLRAPVGGVFPCDDGSYALVLHDQPPKAANGMPQTGYVAGFSFVPVATTAPPKIQGLDAKPVAAAISPSGDRAVVATGKGSVGPFRAYVARAPSLSIDVVDLPSAPIAAGIVPAAGRAFIAQDYVDGRLSLIEFETGAVKTITGFELAAKVVYGVGK